MLWEDHWPHKKSNAEIWDLCEAGDGSYEYTEFNDDVGADVTWYFKSCTMPEKTFKIFYDNYDYDQSKAATFVLANSNPV